MKKEFIEETVGNQGWMEPAEKAFDTVASVTVKRSGGWLKNFLHGTWLGHPLHPASIEVPIGAFTTATVLDLMGTFKNTSRYEPGAKAAVQIGLISAGFAATSGLADWSQTEKPARRVGVLHAVFNSSAATCYLASWLLRRRGHQTAAVSSGIVGWLLLMCGAYLGGRLVYTHQVGVDHAQREGPREFTAVFPESELPENEPHRVEISGVGILLVKQNGRLYAIGERCAHLGGPLAEGKLEGDTIQCPWHGSRYRLGDGQVLNGPSAFSQPCFEARVHNGQIEVRLGKTGR